MVNYLKDLFDFHGRITPYLNEFNADVVRNIIEFKESGFITNKFRQILDLYVRILIKIQESDTVNDIYINVDLRYEAEIISLLLRDGFTIERCKYSHNKHSHRYHVKPFNDSLISVMNKDLHKFIVYVLGGLLSIKTKEEIAKGYTDSCSINVDEKLFYTTLIYSFFNDSSRLLNYLETKGFECDISNHDLYSVIFIPLNTVKDE